MTMMTMRARRCAVVTFAHAHRRRRAPRAHAVKKTSLDVAARAMMLARAPVRDRTSEFERVAERIKKTIAASASAAGDGVGVGGASASAAGGAVPSTSTSSSSGNASDFAKMASAIGHGIHRTSLKLEKLASLAKASSLFDDRGREIAETSAVIKMDIQALNESIAELQNTAARQRAQGSGNKSASDHSGTVVDTLKNRLATATKSFKEVLTARQANIKAGDERRAKFGAINPTPAANASLDYLGDDAFARALRQTPTMGFGNLQGGGASGARDFVPRPNAPGALGPPQMQTQGQLQMINQNTSYADSRQEALQNVERTITELGGIFQQLATMVSEQGELAIRIDENVDDTLANVDNAQTQLLKYLNTVSSNRWLILKLFGILMAFFSFFIIFVA